MAGRCAATIERIENTFCAELDIAIPVRGECHGGGRAPRNEQRKPIMSKRRQNLDACPFSGAEKKAAPLVKENPVDARLRTVREHQQRVWNASRDPVVMMSGANEQPWTRSIGRIGGQKQALPMNHRL